MKSVLISIQPKWVEKIINGEKTIEVRKSRPKIETPFKCYIYCTKQKPYLYKESNPPFELFLDSQSYRGGSYEDRFFSDKVIGEFVCDRVYKWECKNRLEILESFPTWRASYMFFVDDLEKTCLTYDDLWDYGKGKPLYGWHISDLKIYDKPKALGNFFTPMGKRPSYMIERPPKSWCYVEEI